MAGFYNQASGYGSVLENTPLARPDYYNKILSVDFERNWTHEITNTELIGEIKADTLEIQYMKAPEVGKWRPSSVNQEMIPSGISLVAESLRVDKLAYIDVKIDELTVGYAGSRYANFEKSFLEKIWRNYAELQRNWLLNRMLYESDPRWKGLNAGIFRNYNLGDIGTPVTITPANLAKNLAYLRQVLVDNLAWVENEMFVVMPSQFFPVLIDSNLANAGFTGTARPGTVQIDGMWKEKIMGFDVIETIHAPKQQEDNGNTCFYILAGHKDAFAYAGAIVKSRVTSNPRTFGIEYQALARWGGKMIYPDKLAVGYWHFEI